nr:MAK10-like protein [Tanacetum cinerariifolium]
MPGRQLGALLQTHGGNSETKLMKEIPYELIKDDQKKKLWKNNEANMTLYNALPCKEYAKYSCVKPPRRFERGRGNSFDNKGGESSKKKRVGYNCEIEAHFASECKMSKETKAFVRGAWSDENPIRTLGDYSKPIHDGYRNTIELPEGNNVAISLPQDVPSTSDRRLIELKNQVQRLMKAHLAAKQPVQVNKITSSCEIYSGPHDTQFFIENHEPTFVEYASSHTDKVGGKCKMTNKIDIVLKAITDRITGALPSDAVKNPKLNVNYTSLVLSTRSYPTRDPQCSSHSPNSVNVSKTCSKETNHSQKDRLQMVTEIRTRQTKEPQQTLKDKFKDLHLNFPILEVIAHAPMYNAILDKYVENLELRKNGSAFIQDGTKSYPVGIVRDVEVYIKRHKFLNDFYIINMKKDLETPLLVGRGFIATAIAVIDCRKAKIAIGEEINRSVFRVKGIKLGEEEAPYWTKLGKKESYRPQPSSDGVGAQTPYYARKEFMDCHLPKE